MKNKTPSSNNNSRILAGDYSQELKFRLQHAIAASKQMEKSGTPAILYVAAWEKDHLPIWYEYTSTQFSLMLGCHPTETAERFCNSVMERRIYKYTEMTEKNSHALTQNIEKRLESHGTLNSKRESLRDESISQGITEAVYKIRLEGLPSNTNASVKTKDANEFEVRPTRKNREIWLKDIANIEWYPKDNLFLSLGFLTDVTKEMEAEDERERLLNELQVALEKVKVLSGLIPICANCKQIRDDKGYWNQIEAYISKHSDAQFSHGICPDCAKKLYPEYYEKHNRE